MDSSTLSSQVTVALYVFCKSWSSSADKRLLLAAILLFILGVFKCFKKPLALKRASFNSIVKNFQYSTPQMTTENREVELEKYIQEARAFVQLNQQDPQTSNSNRLTLDEKRTTSKHRDELSKPDKLFVDYAYVYPDRLDKLKSLWLLNKENTYDALCVGLSRTFNLIYSRLFKVDDGNRDAPASCSDGLNWLGGLLVVASTALPRLYIYFIYYCRSYPLASSMAAIKKLIRELISRLHFYYCTSHTYWKFRPHLQPYPFTPNGQTGLPNITL